MNRRGFLLMPLGAAAASVAAVLPEAKTPTVIQFKGSGQFSGQFSAINLRELIARINEDALDGRRVLKE